MKKETLIPFVLERTDCMVVQQVQPRHPQSGTTTTFEAGTAAAAAATAATAAENSCTATLQFLLHASFSESSGHDAIRILLDPILNRLHTQLTSVSCYQHVACVVLQRMLRSMLMAPRRPFSSPHLQPSQQEQQNRKSKQQYLNAVAFIADGSLLPRKSGRSVLPMPSPPSLPFVSPQHQGGDGTATAPSQLTKFVTVNVGHFWRRFLNELHF